MSNKGIHKQGRHNRALSLVEEKLRCQLRLHEETVRQHQIAQEREKVRAQELGGGMLLKKDKEMHADCCMSARAAPPRPHSTTPACLPRVAVFAASHTQVLCDQVLHQAFFSEFMAAVEQQEAAEAAAGHTAHSQQQQHEQVQQPSLMSHVQQQQVPSSYVVRLLQRRDVLQQVQQVRQMTARDWLQYFSTLFPKVSSVTLHFGSILALASNCHTRSCAGKAAKVPGAGRVI